MMIPSCLLTCHSIRLHHRCSTDAPVRVISSRSRNHKRQNVCVHRSSTTSCACSNLILPPITIRTPRISSSSRKRRPSPNAFSRYCTLLALFFYNNSSKSALGLSRNNSTSSCIRTLRRHAHGFVAYLFNWQMK